MSQVSEFPPSFWSPVDCSQAAFVANNATVLGKVTLKEGSSIWYSSVVRADVEAIIVGRYSNVQDGAVLHGDPGIVTTLEDYVTVGHRAVIHSAHIEQGCLIGIGAIILDGVRIGAGSIIGAGAIVTKDIEPRSLAMGIPARPKRETTDLEVENLREHALHYYKLALVHAGKGTDLGFTTRTQPK